MTSVQNQSGQQVQNMTAVPKVQGYQTVPQPAPQPITSAPFIPPMPQQAAPMPNYAGVNIQIYNPSVGVPNLNQGACAHSPQGMPGIAYPSNYYTNQWGQQINQNPAQKQTGNANELNASANTDSGSTKDTTKLTDINKETTTVKEEQKSDKKTEKRKVVELTDEYIKNLENYLNSQDAEIRMMGAKEVVARLEEDNSRKDDPALNALINKMLQDPSQQIRFLALAMLDSRTVTGDAFTVNVLKNMQNSPAGYGQDAIQAANILLKMSGKTVEKEFEVKDTSKNEKK